MFYSFKVNKSVYLRKHHSGKIRTYKIIQYPVMSYITSLMTTRYKKDSNRIQKVNRVGL